MDYKLHDILVSQMSTKYWNSGIYYIQLENMKLVEVLCGFPGILSYFEVLNGNYKYSEYSVDSINVFR